MSVKVEGTIETGLSPEGEQRLHFTASRSVTTADEQPSVARWQGRHRGQHQDDDAMPGPDEVLSFEMPPLRTADGATLPDRFSIRVRVNAPSGR